jgi:crotonobetainyl-CoA:carnitine CoA-transferase CaiB-like acyl-CoA transferase
LKRKWGMVGTLEGVRVMETASVYAGPMAGRILADWGADVIHIEHPVRGDIARSESAKRVGKAIVGDVNYRMENFNRGKRGMTLDLSAEGGPDVLRRLLKTADVFISNFRPRELKRFGLEYDTLCRLNPGLICANVTGYGRKGPDKDLPGYEFTSYFPRSGMLHVLQAPGALPIQPPLGLGDNVAGLALALGIMTALFLRERTGEGQEVDVSLFQAGVHALSLDVAGALATGQDRRPVEREEYGNPLVAPYETGDGRWLFLGVSQPDPYWSSFCRAIGREELEDDPRFSSFEERIESHAALFHILEEAFRTRSLAEWKPRLDEAGLPWSPIQSLPEVAVDPQARANDFFATLEHPTYGSMEVVAGPVRLSKASTAPMRAAPELGQHTEEVLQEHGYTWGDIEGFKEQGVIA